MDKASWLTFCLVIIIFGLSISVAVFAFTGPLQIPTGGDTALWLLNGTNMYYTVGSVGIGTTTPAYKLDVEGGDVSASTSARADTSLCIGASCWTQWQDIPSNAVMFFATSTCPSGWTEFTDGRGRYIVGVPSSGTLAGTVGTALTNLENRPVGQHTHTINDPGHTHSGDTNLYGSGSDAGGGDSYMWWGLGESNSGVSINASGTVAGTNAPYIQYLICQKS